MSRKKHKAKKAEPQQPAAGGRPTRLALLLLVAVPVALAAALWLGRDDPEALYAQAQTLLERDPGRAERLLDRGIDAAGGDFPEAQLLRCQLHARQGRWLEARGGFSLIGDTRACDPAGVLHLAQAAHAAGEDVLAEMALAAPLQPGPAQQQQLRTLIARQLQHGQQEAALDRCQQLSELAPDDPYPWQVQGKLYQQRGEIFPAIAAYRQALQRGPPAEQAEQLRALLAESLMQSGELAEARRELDRLLDSRPSPAARLKNAYLLRLEGHVDEALEVAQQLVGQQPQWPQARMIRGVLHLDQGRPQQALDDLQQVIQAEPYDKGAHYKLAQAYLQLNRPEQAQPHLETSDRLTRLTIRIMDLESQANAHSDPSDLARQLAELYRQIGQVEKARLWQRRAEAPGP